MQTFINFFLNCLYPSYCIMCQVLLKPGQVWCDDCQKQVARLPPYRTLIGRKRPLVVHAVSAYRPPLDWLVRAKAYRMRTAASMLGQLIGDYLIDMGCHYDLLLPVPLHWSRRVWRGYNQAVVIAAAITEKTNIPCVQPFRRNRYTSVQRRLSRDQRRENVSQAFDSRTGWQRRRTRRLLAGKRILIIDDVYTTGATVTALARAVWLFAPQCVHVAVACRVVDE